MFSFRSLSAKARIAVAAGVALAAPALAVPAAYASTAPHSPAPAVRTVDISVPAAASSGCVANIPGPSADHNHERIDQWWYLRNGCVGTVITTTYVTAGGHCVNPQLRVYGNGALGYKNFVPIPGTTQKRFICPVPGFIVKARVSWPVHLPFAFPIEVRATAEFQGGGGELGRAIAVVH